MPKLSCLAFGVFVCPILETFDECDGEQAVGSVPVEAGAPTTLFYAVVLS